MISDDPSSLRRRVIVSLALILILLAAGAGVFALLVSLGEEPERTPPGPPRTLVRVREARRGTWSEVLEGYGRARALRSARVSAEVTGRVIWIDTEVEPGMAVEEGRELLRIDPGDYTQAVALAEARRDQALAAVERLSGDLASSRERLSIAREDLKASRRELARIAGLVEGQIVTASELDRQQVATSQIEQSVLELESLSLALVQQLASAEAEIRAAGATLARSVLDRDRTTIRAPHPGWIESRAVSVGDRVAPGTLLFRMVDPSRVEVPIALGASRYGEVRVGAKARVRLREGGPVVWEGAVARLAPVVDPADRTFLVYLLITAGEGPPPVPPGTFVVGEVDGLVHQGVIPVPRIAFLGDRLYVAVPRGEGQEAVVTERVPVVGRHLPEVALVASGIAEGDLVIVSNLEAVADGAVVRVAIEENGTTADAEPRPEEAGSR